MIAGSFYSNLSSVLLPCLALHVAARGSYAESCKYLLEASGGELGTIEDGNGQTALHTVVEGMALGGVAMEQVLVCMELLIQAGLQPDQPDHEMRTYVHLRLYN